MKEYLRWFRYVCVGMFAWGALSCDPVDTPDVVVGEPVFWLKLEIDGKKEHWIAGNEGYYMFADFRWESDTRLTMTGTLSHATAPEKYPRLTFRVKHLAPGTQDVPKLPEKLLLPGTYTWEQDLSLPRFQWVQFENQTLGDGELTYVWDLGDGTTTAEAHPLHRYRLDGAPVFVTLNAQDAEGKESTITNAIDFSQQGCVNFIHEDPEDLAVAVQFADSAQRHGLFTWQLVSDSAHTTHQDTFLVDTMPLPKGTDHVCLISAPAGGCEHGYCRNIPSESSPVTANFVYDAQAGPEVPVENVAVSLEYSDESQNLWTSTSMEQDVGSFFRITGAKEYDRNELGKLTRKIQIVFDVQLEDPLTGNGMHMAGEGYIALGVPE